MYSVYRDAGNYCIWLELVQNKIAIIRTGRYGLDKVGSEPGTKWGVRIVLVQHGGNGKFVRYVSFCSH